MRPMLLAWWLAIVSPHMSARRLSSKARDAALVLCAAFALLALPACSPSTQDRAVQSAVVASNETAAVISGLQTSALSLYQLEQELSVAAAYNRGDSKAEAIARVYSIRKSWEPVWSAFEALRLAHQTMATLISTAGTTAAQLDSAKAAVALKLSQVQALLSDARTRIGG